MHKTVKQYFFIGLLVLLLLSVLSILLILVSEIKTIINHGMNVDYKDCEIKPYEDFSPIVVLNNSTDFVYPDNETVRFDSNTNVDFICPGGKVIIGSNIIYQNKTPALCKTDTIFEVDSQHKLWKDIHCDTAPQSSARYTGVQCVSESDEIEIGFEVNGRFMLKTILICFHRRTQQALYSHSNLTQHINKSISAPRPSWTEGNNLFKIDSVDDYYKRDRQRKTINSLLGYSENSTRIINNTYYLTRGHLTAKADNFYASQQNLSFILVNAAPQWNSFNGGNWEKVERSVRNYATENKVDLLQWTGVYGVLSLPHSTSMEMTKLYIYVNNSTKYLPVPEIFWKVVYDPISKKGISIIGLNNPLPYNYTVFCNDVTSKIKWLQVEWNKTESGLIYTCEIEDFRKTITYLPVLDVRGLLD